jgi:hypothetical protein
VLPLLQEFGSFETHLTTRSATKLRSLLKALGPCGVIAAGPEDPPLHLFEVEATIEPISEGAQVAINLLLKLYGVERSAEAGF